MEEFFLFNPTYTRYKNVNQQAFYTLDVKHKSRALFVQTFPRTQNLRTELDWVSSFLASLSNLICHLFKEKHSITFVTHYSGIYHFLTQVILLGF